MRLAAPALWLLVVLWAALYLGMRLQGGVPLQSDLLALLPRAEQDATAQRAEDRVTAAFSRRIVLLIGNRDRAASHAASRALVDALTRSGFATSITSTIDSETQRRLAAGYFPFRGKLLAAADRAMLEAGDGDALVKRALGIVYGPGGVADANLLGRDPFLLMPAFFADLPLPQSRLTPDDGVLTVEDGGITYSFISAELSGDAFSLSFQDQFGRFLDRTIAGLEAATPDLRVLRTGAVFYARDGATEANRETSEIGAVSLVGTVLLVLGVFRALRPIVLTVLAIGTGILCALSASLWLFGELHVLALLFGVSLIGISVDYSLQYFCEYFDPAATDPSMRLERVMAGVAIGLGTTLIGYLTLLLAPFPGLRQVAMISVVGLAASGITVALWYPLLDRGGPVGYGRHLLVLGAGYWAFWERPRHRLARRAIMLAAIVLGGLGATMITSDDDVRHLQSLSPALKRQEQEIQRLTAVTGGAQFFLVQAADQQTALEREEQLISRLDQGRRDGLISGYRAPAQFVPSIARQKQNETLIRDRLTTPHLAAYLAQLGLDPPADADDGRFLTLDDLPKDGPLALLSSLVLDDRDGAVHIVLLTGADHLDALARLADGLPGIRLLSPAEDISRLFGQYRRYAVMLLVLSAVLMLPLLIWRYGFGSALRVMAPSIAAVVLAPSLAALMGLEFTFFNAMALVLVLSIGVDYSVFCRETSGVRKPVTMLAVALAAMSSLLSFGLLALSRVFAVHAFGETMLIGIALAFLFAPAAGDALSASAPRTAE